MISTHSLALAAALALASCSGRSERASPTDWQAALASGDAAGAEIALKQRLRDGAPVAELSPYLGEAELRQGDLVEARKWLGGADFAPDVAARGYHMLGRLRMAEGDLRGAGAAFDQALRGAARDPGLWVDIARLRYRGGEQAQAIEASKEAVALGSENPAALLLNAQLVRDAAGNAAALPLFARGLEVAPDNADLLAEYAATLGELGRAQDMLAATRRLTVAAPGDRRALYLQAVLAARAGRHDLARTLLQRGEGGDTSPAATLLLAMVNLENGNPASATQAFDRLLAGQRDNARVATLLARALAASGSHRELIARFGAEAQSRYIALLVGRAYEKLGDRATAAVHLDRALRRGGEVQMVPLAPRTPLNVALSRTPADGVDTVAVVRGLVAGGRSAQARATAEAWLRRHRGSAEARALAGDTAFLANDPRAAIAHYRAAAAIRQSWLLTKRMAAAYEAAGDTAAAEALVAAQLASAPNNAEAAALLARRLTARGDRQQADRLYVHAANHGG